MVRLDIFSPIAVALALSASAATQAISTGAVAEGHTQDGSSAVHDTPLAAATSMLNILPILPQNTTNQTSLNSSDIEALRAAFLNSLTYGIDELESLLADFSQSSDLGYLVESALAGSETPEMKQWVDVGAAVLDEADIHYDHYNVEGNRLNVEKFSEFIARSEFITDSYAEALKQAYLEWKLNGSSGPIPSAALIIASIEQV